MPTLVRSSMMRWRARRARETLMDFEDLADLPLDRMQRIERRHRLLEDHGDVVAAHLAQRALIGMEQLLALEADLRRKDARPTDRAGAS